MSGRAGAPSDRHALVDFALVAGRRPPAAIALLGSSLARAVEACLRERAPKASLVFLRDLSTQPPSVRFDLIVVELEEGSDVKALASAARRLFARRGRLVVACPVPMLPGLFEALSAAGLVPKRLQLVHCGPEARACVALVDARAAKPGGLVVEAPCLAGLSG